MRVDNKDTSVYAKTNYYDDFETFEVVYLPQAGKKVNDNGTLIAIKNIKTDKFFGVKNNQLVSESDKLTDSEKFYVYYGAGNTISLKSLSNGKFVSSASNKHRPITVDKDTPDNYQFVKIIDRLIFKQKFYKKTNKYDIYFNLNVN